MYQPVRPVILKEDKDDIRPQFGPPIISSRSYFAGISQGRLSIAQDGENSILYWDFKP
jgi:hypothetical protein